MERLYELNVPFKTRIDLLRTGTERAGRDGIFTAKVPGSRALIVTDLYGCTAQGWTETEFAALAERRYDSALRRAGIGPNRKWNIHVTSLDTIARDPKRVPLAAYPLHPAACARLIGDLAVFTVETSGQALAEALRDADIDAEWVLPPNAPDLTPGQVVMELHRRVRAPLRGGMALEFTRTLQLRRSELERYLIELIDPGTWTEGVKRLLNDYQAEGRPWTTYRDEHEVWV